MRAFAEAYPEITIVQQLVARLPWGHNIRIFETVKTPAQREWYARQVLEHGWSRNVLVHQIESGLFDRQGKAFTNFSRNLPATQSELAQELIKDPYCFDFLAIGPDMLERDLERAAGAPSIAHPRTRQGICFRRKSVSPGGRWQRFLP